MKIHNKIAVIMKNGDLVTIDQLKTIFAGTKIEPVLYRISTYIWNIKKEGGIIKTVKNKRNVVGYQLLNGTEFDANGYWVGIVEEKKVA